MSSDGKAVVHAVLVSVFGRGVLITGRSGIGKSACALELIAGGHTLAADDVVELERRGNRLIGYAPAAQRGFLDIRGLGICDVQGLFGDEALVAEQAVDLSVEICDEPIGACESLGVAGDRFEMLGLFVPRVFFVADGTRSPRVFIETTVSYFSSGCQRATEEFIKTHDQRVLPAAGNA